MRALTGRPRRQDSSGSGITTLNMLEASQGNIGNGASSSTVSNTSAPSSPLNAPAADRDRWFLPRSLRRNSTRENLQQAFTSTTKDGLNETWLPQPASAQAEPFDTSTALSKESGIRRGSNSGSGFFVDREKSTTTNEKLNEQRKASLWKLQTGQSSKGVESDDMAIQGMHGIDTRRKDSSTSSLPSSPLASLRKFMGPPGSETSPSPPSPFSRTHNEQSPPTTPPDSVITEDFLSGKRELSWQSVPRTPSANASEVSNRNRVEIAPLSPPQSASIAGMTSPSKNDIFSADQPILAPAPRILTRVERKPSRRYASESSASVPSRQASFFFESPSAGQSPVTSVFEAQASSIKNRSNTPVVDDRPSYSRTTSAERERERQQILQNGTEVDFRLYPSKEFLLGEGRHSCVYLGSYRTKQTSRREACADLKDLSEWKEGDMLSAGEDEWKLCAIKRPFVDHQSQLLALEEAFALRRLGEHPNIVHLIKIRDEVILACTTPQPSAREPGWPKKVDESTEHQLAAIRGDKVNIARRDPQIQGHQNKVHHGRSSSDTRASQASDQNPAHQLQDDFNPTHRRLASTPIVALQSPDQSIILVDAPTQSETMYEKGVGGCMANTKDDDRALAIPLKSSSETPRLLILLELLPYSLQSFAKRNSDQIGLQQWKEWAIELASVIEWMHSRGCIHADLKPENVLLTNDLHVKICDFNSALFPHPSTPLTDGLGLGTPAYSAPELTRGPNAGTGKGFDYAVDIWSLGSILYSLATGQEPFKRARSMIDILYRKRAFFETEENDRSARLSVAEGSSTAGPGSAYGSASTNVSRHGSLRGRGSIASASSPSASPTMGRRPPMHNRAPSTESIESATSGLGLSAYSGRMPSVRAINMLLDDSPPIGVLCLPEQVGRRSDNSLHRAASDRRPSAHVHDTNTTAFAAGPSAAPNRTASLSRARGSSLLSPDSAERRTRSGTNGSHDFSNSALMGRSRADTFGSPSFSLRPPSHTQAAIQRFDEGVQVSPRSKPIIDKSLLLRPASPLRASSHFDDEERQRDAKMSDLTPMEQAYGYATDAGRREARDSVGSHQDDSKLRLAVTAALTQLSRDDANLQRVEESSGAYTDSMQYAREADESSTADRFWNDAQPYPDGYPALILPGGGRLPDGARDLLKRMLASDADLRPTATQVRLALEAL